MHTESSFPTESSGREQSAYSIFLHPVCTREFRHVADELLYRDADGVAGSMLTPECKIARACSAAFFEVGLQHLVGQRTLILSVTCQIMSQLAVLDFPAEQIMLKLEDTPASLAEYRACLEGLRAAGYRLLLTPQQIEEIGLQASDYIYLSLFDAPAQGGTPPVPPKGVGLFVADIHTQTDYEHALAIGGDWMQGPFFSTAIQVPTPLRNRKGNLAARLGLMQELYRAEPDIGRVEALLSQDPHLVVLVLRQANQNLPLRRREVVSLRQASMLLGLDKLQSMITQLLLANNFPLSALKLKQMLLRAAMCKRVARRLQSCDPSEAFAMGLFSLMDSYHGVDMAELVEMIPFTAEVKAALLLRSGAQGRLLKLVEAFELAQREGRQLTVSDTLNSEYLDSLIWLQQVFIEPTDS